MSTTVFLFFFIFFRSKQASLWNPSYDDHRLILTLSRIQVSSTVIKLFRISFRSFEQFLR